MTDVNMFEEVMDEKETTLQAGRWIPLHVF